MSEPGRPAWLAYVAVVGLLFGAWQYVERQIERRGEDRAVLQEVRDAVSEARAAIREHQQLIADLRVQVADLGQLSRWVHGEIRPGVSR